MNAKDLTSIEELRAFLEGTQRIVFEVASSKDERYRWIQHTLRQFRYSTLSRPDKGLWIRYLIKVSGYSRQQITRLLKQYRDTGQLVRRQRTENGLARRFSHQDIRLLAAMDRRHNRPHGLTLKKLCERAHTVFGESAYQRLASISVAHLYNLRQTRTYRCHALTVEKTQPNKVSTIGERRRPQTEGEPGYIRIDTVHQGDLDKRKGV